MKMFTCYLTQKNHFFFVSPLHFFLILLNILVHILLTQQEKWIFCDRKLCDSHLTITYVASIVMVLPEPSHIAH